MITALENLLKEIEMVEGPLFSPTGKVLPDERLVGLATEDEKKIYSLARHEGREAERATLEYKHSEDGSADEKTWLRAMLWHQDRKKIFMLLFWYAVQERLDSWIASIGIREGWKIVVVESTSLDKLDSMRQLMDLLENLGGM